MPHAIPQTHSPFYPHRECSNKRVELDKNKGSEINLFMLAPTGDWTRIFSRQMEISGRQNIFELSSCSKRQNACCASVFSAIFMLKNQFYSYQKTITTRNQKKSKSSSSNENSPTLKRTLLQSLAHNFSSLIE